MFYTFEKVYQLIVLFAKPFDFECKTYIYIYVYIHKFRISVFSLTLKPHPNSREREHRISQTTATVNKLYLSNEPCSRGRAQHDTSLMPVTERWEYDMETIPRRKYSHVHNSDEQPINSDDVWIKLHNNTL